MNRRAGIHETARCTIQRAAVCRDLHDSRRERQRLEGRQILVSFIFKENSMTFFTKKTQTLITALALLILFGPPAVMAKDIEFTGMLRSYTGSRFSEADTPLTEQTLDFGLQGWGDLSQIRINPYAYVNPEGEPEIGVREAYIDLYLPSLDLRVGKQAVIWGEAEGAFITDIVSPQDLRSFILADFSEIRIGVPAVKADYYAGPFTLEAVWLPRFVPTSQPDTDSIWHISSMPAVSKENLPGDDLENSEIFGKVSYFGALLNAELMAGYAWDDLPVIEGPALNPNTQIPGYERYTVAGGSFSTTVSSLVLRSEAAVYFDRAFTAIVGPGTLGAEKHHQLHSLVGLDWSLFGIDMSAQYILQYIHDYSGTLVAEEFDHTATFRMRDSYLSDTLALEFFAYLGIDPTDALLRPSVTYSLEDGVEIEAGAEVFVGDEGGKFGQYEDNTLGFVSLRWYF
jgi:hypothetical protein